MSCNCFWWIKNAVRDFVVLFGTSFHLCASLVHLGLPGLFCSCLLGLAPACAQGTARATVVFSHCSRVPLKNQEMERAMQETAMPDRANWNDNCHFFKSGRFQAVISGLTVSFS